MTPAELFGEEPPTGERVTHASKLSELRRELALRRNVYPKQIEAGRLEPEVAERQTAVLQAIIADYEIQPWPQTRALVVEWRPRAEALTVLKVPAPRLHREELLAVLAFAVRVIHDAGLLQKEVPP